MVESDECPQPKSNKMDLVGTAAFARSATLSCFLSVIPSSARSAAHPTAWLHISRLFTADQCSVIKVGGKSPIINAMPPVFPVHGPSLKRIHQSGR